jgi:glycosyltransferase involved in cell wall biosynthesis
MGELQRRRLRIAFVCDTIQGELGGGVVAARHFVDELRKEHDVTVVGSDAYGDLQLPMAGFQLPLQSMKKMSFTMSRPDRPRLDELMARVDLVHLQMPFWLSFAARAAAERAHKPIVAAFHVQPENALMNVGLRVPLLHDALYRLWIDGLYNHATAVICPTGFAERKLRAHGLTAPSFVLSNGVPADVRPSRAEKPAELADKIVLLCVGRLAAEKRQDLVIDAVARSVFRDRIHLVLAGGGPREEMLRQKLADSGISGEIGFVSRERLLYLFAMADLMVHASEVELEGIAVLEAMRIGLPALVADGPETAAAEFAASDAFRFRAGDVDSLTVQLDTLLASPALIEIARGVVRHRASGATLEAAASSLSSLYKAIVRPAIALPLPDHRQLSAPGQQAA